MTHKVCKYRLNANGTIPDFICFDNNGFHGAFVVADTLEPSPRGKLMIGITNRNATGDFEAISSQADLETYLTSISSDWTTMDPADPEATVPFDPTAQAAWAWGKLDALNA